MRWIRLDLTWSHSEWLSVLSAESRLAWIELLCYVKGFGAAGRARAVTPERFARMIYVGEDSVRQMLKAAEIAGALAIADSDWVIVKWREYQGDETANERMQRYRQAKKERDVTDVTRNVTPVTDVTTTETETYTETYITPPTPPLKSGGTRTAPKLVFPDELKTPSFRVAWDDWVSYRKARKLTVVEATLQGQLTKLAKFDDPVALIRQSIENGWQGLFALKDPPNRQPVAAQPKAVRYHNGEQIR